MTAVLPLGSPAVAGAPVTQPNDDTEARWMKSREEAAHRRSQFGVPAPVVEEQPVVLCPQPAPGQLVWAAAQDRETWSPALVLEVHQNGGDPRRWPVEALVFASSPRSAAVKTSRALVMVYAGRDFAMAAAQDLPDSLVVGSVV